jgi:hypothetical protein
MRKIKKNICYILIVICSIITGIMYLPFCQLNQLYYDDRWPQLNYKIKEQDDLYYKILYTVAPFVVRMYLYPNCYFITKGSTFENVSCNDDNDNIHNVSLKFNWDNSITITVDSKLYSIEVDSISLHPGMYKGYVTEGAVMGYTSWETNGKVVVDSMYVYHPSDEEYFVRIEFFDKKGNKAAIDRQQSSLPHGRQRYAFDFSINGKELWTGKETGFDY